jgi:8-oxo-dGTP pyrophosphatase MutT (NUDIX family)
MSAVQVMDLNLLTEKLKTGYSVPEPPPMPDDSKSSAVLVVLYPRHRQPHVLLIQRSEALRLHAGEISFPGGTPEEPDGSLLTTALRETREELNLNIPPSQVLALLPTVETLTGYVISPFITILDQLPDYRQNPDEVQKVLEIPLLPLLSTHHPEMGYTPKKQMVAYWHLEHRVWGATAKILNQIRRLDSAL